MHIQKRFVSLLGLAALVCASSSAQIVPIQGSDPISNSRTVINSNFTYLNGKQVTGSGAPSAGTCSSGTVGLLYTDTNPSGLFYVCMHTGTGYAWVTPNNPNAVLTTNVYANPPWIQSLDWSKLINIPPFPNSQLQLSGTNLPQRGTTNLVPSTGVTITTADNPSTNTTTLTFSASGSGGSNGTVSTASSGQIAVYAQTGNTVSGVTPAGDAAISTSTGQITVSKTGGVAFAPSATTDTTNPTNIPYTSAANGASASNLKNIANTFLTPDNFGCHMVADSTTDNSCLASAINSALAAGNDIRIPAANNTTSGTNHYYAVRSPISINLRSHPSTDINQGLTIQCEGSGTTIAYTGADATQGLFKFIGSSGGGLDNVTIKNCTLASAVNAQYVVQFNGVSGPKMSDVNIRAAGGATVQYNVQYLGSQQGSILGGSNTNGQTGIYEGTLFSTQSGTQSTTTTASVASTDATISLASCGLLSGNWGNNVFIIDSEHIRASACSGGTVTVASTCGQQGTTLCRGAEGTQATSHISGALATTGSTITSNQITIAGGVQFVCNQNCVYADGVDDGLLAGNSIVNSSGNSGVMVNGTGNGSYKIWGNDITASAGTAVYVLGGKADITGTKGSGLTMLNCASGYCFFHDNQNVQGAITYSSTSTGSYFDNVLVNTNQNQVTLNSPSLIAWNNSLPSDVNFSTLSNIFRLDSPIVVSSNYTPPSGDIASIGVNANAPAAAYGLNISGSTTSGQFAYLRFNKGLALGVAAGSQNLIIGTDSTFSGMIASFGSGSITFNRTATGVQFNGVGPNPYQANGVNGVTGQANIGACQFTFAGILTSGVGSTPVSCGYYQTIIGGSTAMPQRAKLAFTGSGVNVSDNGTDTTTVTISGGGSSSAGGSATAYSQTVSAQTSLSVAATTHKQGSHPIISCADNATPANYVDCKATVDSSGNVAFAWPTAFTGSVTITGGSAVSIPGSSSLIAQYTMDFSGQNLFFSSNNPGDTANWAFTQASTSSQSLTGPLGGSITAWSLIDTSVNNTHSVEQDTTPASSGSTYTISWYVKPQGSNHWAYIYTGDDSFADNAFFDASACTVGAVASKMFGATATAALNGWCRISVSHTDSGSRAFGIGIATGDTVKTYAGTGTGQFYIYGGQFVIGTSPVSYGSDTGTTLTVTDSSGLGNNAATYVSANAPLISSHGVNFAPGEPVSGVTPQYISMPSAVKPFGTATFAMCTWPGAQTSNDTQFPSYATLFGATTNDGPWLLNSNAFSMTNEGGWLPSIYDSSAAIFRTYSGDSNAFAGCHIVTYVCSGPERLYVDGSEVTYSAQYSGACALPTGQFVIGGAPGVADPRSNAFQGEVAYAVFNSTALPQDTVKALSAYLQGVVSARSGFPAYPATNGSAADQLIAIGDSITSGVGGGGTTWPGSISSHLFITDYSISNWAISTTTARTWRLIDTERTLGQYASAAARNTFVVWLGTNDVSNISMTEQQTWASLVDIGRHIHQRGGRAIAVTMISRTGNDTHKNNLNPLIRAYWKSSGAFDGIADLAEDTVLGCDGCYSNSTYFADGVHPNGTTQSGVVAPDISQAINSLDGYSEGNPHIVTATYAMTSADNVLDANMASSGQTVTLPNCTALTGYTYTIVNPSANSITIAGFNGSQTISGSATLAANSTGKFLILLSGQAAGGCTWARTQ